MKKVEKTIQVGDQQIQLETGRLAKQADGAVTVRLGDTVALVAAVGARSARPGQSFFPLTVDYREKASAAGRFPGGYFKREGRPTEKEILTCRLTDRPIRPLFPSGYLNEVQVQSIVLSADGENDPDILSIMGASAALSVSDIPWDGPLGAARIGRVNGEWIANPTHQQREDSDIDLIYVGSGEAVVMIEGAADEIPEAEFIEALRFGQEAIQPQIACQRELIEEIGVVKREVVIEGVPEDVQARANEICSNERINDALSVKEKAPRERALSALKEEMGEKLLTEFGDEIVSDSLVGELFYQVQKRAARSMILDGKSRMDGRSMDTLRPVDCEVGFIPRTHGSALFTRGETQALASATLGTTEDAQEFDSYTGGPSEKRFILHYNFPNFSVGETGRIMGPGRREIGHGALAERSIAPIVPVDEFPYAIRLTSEVLESNGSSSMATVCAGTLALMDAGVPIKRPVAGISIGLCTEFDDSNKISRYELLTDILGAEDGFGDMDCKIAGTTEGITGFQLDLKLRGLPIEIMEAAVEQARQTRMSILETMALTIAKPREQLSQYAPRIETVQIDPDKIGMIIGPGGKNIKALVDRTGCEINIDDDGSIHIYSIDGEGMRMAKEEILSMTAEIEDGKVYRGRVVSVKEFGCFVEALPGKEGLCHISELANFRVKRTEDIVREGDEIWVKCLGTDDKGRVRLSRKAAMADRDEEVKADAPAPADESPEESPDDDDADVSPDSEVEATEKSDEPSKPRRRPRRRRPAAKKADND